MKKNIGKLGAVLAAVLLLVSVFSTTAFAAVTSLPDSTTERVLKIYKYSPITRDGNDEETGTPGDGTTDVGTALDGKTPLENVAFEIYRIPDTQTTSPTPTEDEITAIAVAGNLEATVVTGEGGLATYSFGTTNLKDGTYLIVEKDNPAVSAKAAPFYVSVPMEHPSVERESPGKKSSVSSHAELEKLRQEADDFAEEQARKKAVEAERADKSKSIWNWFGSGDRMSGMSNEAKAVNQSLDAKRVNTTLDR